MRTALVLSLLCSPCLAVEWEAVANPLNEDSSYAEASVTPAGPDSEDTDGPDTGVAGAHASNTKADAQATVGTTIHTVHGNPDIVRVAAALDYDCQAQADATVLLVTAEAAGKTIRRQFFKASEAGVMRGEISANVGEAINVPGNVTYIDLAVHIGKSVATWEYDGTADKWYLTGIRLYRATATGEELIMSWQDSDEHWTEGVTSLGGAPIPVSERVAKGELIDVEVWINATVDGREMKIRADAGPSGDPDVESKLVLQAVGTLIND